MRYWASCLVAVCFIIFKRINFYCPVPPNGICAAGTIRGFLKARVVENVYVVTVVGIWFEPGWLIESKLFIKG